MNIQQELTDLQICKFQKRKKVDGGIFKMHIVQGTTCTSNNLRSDNNNSTNSNYLLQIGNTLPLKSKNLCCLVV